jgi:very-short-patch-repair endonuclease
MSVMQKIAIEIDGSQHVTDSEQILTDFKRSEHSIEHGISTIHISNKEIKDNSGGVASAISEASAILSEEIQK